MIHYVAFRSDVSISVGGKFTSINNWDTTKHASTIQVEQREGYVYLYPLIDGKRTDRRRKIPMSSVAYIDESYEQTGTPGKART